MKYLWQTLSPLCLFAGDLVLFKRRMRNPNSARNYCNCKAELVWDCPSPRPWTNSEGAWNQIHIQEMLSGKRSCRHAWSNLSIWWYSSGIATLRCSLDSPWSRYVKKFSFVWFPEFCGPRTTMPSLPLSKRIFESFGFECLCRIVLCEFS